MDGPVRVFDEAPPIAYTRRVRFVPRWWRWRNHLRVAAGAVAFIFLVGGGYVFSQRSVATNVTVSDAVGQFRSGSRSEPANTQATVVDGASGKDVVGSRGPVQAASPVSRQPSHVVATPAVPYVLPAEGVYTYATSGGEQISVAGAHHDYPPHSTATVRHLGGCRWQIRSDVIKEHTDDRTFCSRTTDLYQNEQARWVTFYGKRDGEGFTFTPPMLVSAISEAIGTKSTATARNPNGDSVTVNRTYLGRVPLTIAGKVVRTVRVHLAGTSTGKSQGTFVDDLWLDPLTGLTLRWDRSVDEVADASFGARVHYTEKASFVLESLTPQT